jgi:hypothetical protein
MKTSSILLAGALSLMVGPWVSAQTVTPAKGQDAATQARDETECSGWATQQTGFDPAKPYSASSDLRFRVAPGAGSVSAQQALAVLNSHGEPAAIAGALIPGGGGAAGAAISGLSGGGLPAAAGALVPGAGGALPGAAGAAIPAVSGLSGGALPGAAAAAIPALSGAAPTAAVGALTGGHGAPSQALSALAPQNDRGAFDRARATCLSARGYTVQ